MAKRKAQSRPKPVSREEIERLRGNPPDNAPLALLVADQHGFIRFSSFLCKKEVPIRPGEYYLARVVLERTEKGDKANG